MSSTPRSLAFLGWVVLAVAVAPYCQSAARAGGPVTGPLTEKRFPPLHVPPGFKATLFACDPLVEYPSVVARGPKPGALFVAHDYMTGLGVEIVRRDEVRLLSDADGDGYADKSTVYAGGFNSIQGLEHSHGTVFVMHAPFLTALKDTDGDGVADSRRDIVKGLGLPPEENSNRLHCANGVVAGHDGWLYLALGDRGCDVKRPEGDRLLFRQGGILRCRHDGRDLHVFAGGLRNIYDVALDEELNVFVRDNENDGGDYMIRVCRSFCGADHGYPYLYNERTAEALAPLADLGRGSSAGGTSYLETAFPQAFRESLFFCEWGRAVVRYRKQRAGSHFTDMKEIDFAAGAPDDPYGFKPTDLVVDYDGSLLISDWCDGQRPKRGRGRIYRITWAGDGVTAVPRKRVSRESQPRELIEALNSPSYYSRVAAQREFQRRGNSALPALKAALKAGELNRRGRLHAVWLLARQDGADAIDELFDVAKTDSDPVVRAQAVRALADVTDPILVRHRLAAGRGDERLAARVAGLLAKKQDARVVLEVLVALGRLRWSAAPDWSGRRWETLPHDPSIEHATMQLLRRADNWPAVLKLLDRPTPKSDRTGLRAIALRAVADRTETAIVDGLIERLPRDRNAAHRREYVDALARIHRKPAAWTYWGFRPAPRPANTITWERTGKIRETLANTLSDVDASVRMTALTRMRRENIPIPLTTLARQLSRERETGRVQTILEAIAEFPADEVRGLLQQVVQDRFYAESNRLQALASLAGGIPESSEKQLVTLARTLEDGPVLAAAIREIGRRKQIDQPFLLARLNSQRAVVRAAAMEVLAEHNNDDAAGKVAALLADPDVRVRRAAAFAAGRLRVPGTARTLRALATSSDAELRRRSLLALLALRDAHAVAPAVAALKERDTQLAALAYLTQFGDAEQTSSLLELTANSRSMDVTTAVVRAFTAWQSESASAAARAEVGRAIATVQRRSGVLISWSVTGPLTRSAADAIAKNLARPVPQRPSIESGNWRTQLAAGTDAAVHLAGASAKSTMVRSWFAVSYVYSERAAEVEFLASAAGKLHVWLNGRRVFQRMQAAAYRPDSERFSAQLSKGLNRVVVRIDGPSNRTQFHLRFRTKSSQAEHERLVQLALSGRGSASRGREVFFNAEKSQCIRCHRLGGQGGRIGPDLTGIGARFSKIHIVESLLEPSRTIAPSYATIVVALADGRVVTGVKTAQSARTLTLGDKEGKTHELSRADIELVRRQSKSTMPDGLEKRLTDREFLDLLAFLLSQKTRTARR